MEAPRLRRPGGSPLVERVEAFDDAAIGQDGRDPETRLRASRIVAVANARTGGRERQPMPKTGFFLQSGGWSSLAQLQDERQYSADRPDR